MHDVGTLRTSSGQRLNTTLTGIDTPSLIGLHNGAPYLHHGAATSLTDVFTLPLGGEHRQAEDQVVQGNGSSIWTNSGSWPVMGGARGGKAVLIIDEAQNLPRDLLEQLRLLTNLETSERNLPHF